MRFWQTTACCTAFVLTATLFSTAAQAASGPTVRIGSATGDSGQEVTTRLEVLDVPDPGLGAFTIDIAYDKDVVEAVSCQGDPADSLDTIACNTDYEPDTVRVAGFRTTSGLTGDVALADVTFRLTGDEGECSDLTVSIVELTDPSATALSSPRTENGSICVGDADGGGSISSTPSSQSKTTPSAQLNTTPSTTSKPGSTGRPPAFAETNGTQQPEGTTAPGETGSALEDDGTPSSSATASSSTTQGSEEEGAPAEATRAAAGQSAKRQAQTAEDGSDGGSSAWLIAIGLIVAAVALAGAGAMVWKRRSARRL